MSRRAVVACAVFSLVVSLGWQTAAFAGGDDHHHPYGPHGAVITTSTSVTSPGGNLKVCGENFAPSESITLTLHTNTVTLGTTTADPNGSFCTPATIPSSTKQGDHTITATGSTGDSASTEIFVKIVHGHPDRHHRHGHGGPDYSLRGSQG